MMWQHNVYYVCVTFSVVRYVGLFIECYTHTSPHRTSRTHNKRYAATSPRQTIKNFKLSDFLKFSDCNVAPTNSLMMIY